MYLLPAGAAARNNRKLQGLRGSPYRKTFFLTGGRRLRGLRGLGDAQDPNEIDPLTGETYGDESVPGSQAAWKLYQAINQAAAATTPTSPGTQASGPVRQVVPNLSTNMQPSQSPLDYVSPQAAIAAGLNSTVVYAAWAQGLAKFPTQQAALQSGIPAGVVTQLWSQSRAYVGAPTSFLDQKPLGVANKWLLLTGAGIVALVSAGKRGR